MKRYMLGLLLLVSTQINSALFFDDDNPPTTWTHQEVSPGTLDATFNRQGSAGDGSTAGFYQYNTGTRIYAMQIQQDGKILIAGFGDSTQWLVGRLNADGTLDTSFNAGGSAGDGSTAGFYQHNAGDVIYAMQIQQDGKILVAGHDENSQWLVGRLNAVGTLDTSFNANASGAGGATGDGSTAGFYQHNAGDAIQAMQIQQDGKVLIAGYASGNQWLAGRLNADGTLDTSFNANASGAGGATGDGSTAGFYQHNTGRIIYAMQIQQHGKILIAGYNDSTQWLAGRLNNNIHPVLLAASKTGLLN